MAYKTGNPALNKNTFNNLPAVAPADAMTLEGTATKSLILLVVAVIAGYLGWGLVTTHPGVVSNIMFLAFIALGVALAIIFNKSKAPILAPIYAVIEGFILGVISKLYDASFEGIFLQAILITTGIFLTMLIVYRLRLIQATENFKLGVASATGGIALYYLADLLFGFFGKNLPLIQSNSTAGIIFSLVVVAIAAFNLVVDFDFIEQGVKNNAPKYMEWYSSFGLFVTLVWLYLEVLRLLSKRRR